MRQVARRVVLVLLGAALAAFAAVGWATPRVRIGPAPVSSVIYPAQEINVAFDHAMHVADMGLGCADCHRLAAESRSTQDILIPQEATCVDCHDARPEGMGTHDVTEACRYCHPGPAKAAIQASRVPPARLKFSHAAHSENECVRCHTRIPMRTLGTVDDLPTMPMCLACHDGQAASRQCTTCHLAEPDGVLRVELGQERLLPPDWMQGIYHGGTWGQNHGGAATARTQLCNACHREHECLACHDGSVRPRDVHPSDWMSLHAPEARASGTSCTSCHRSQSFCRTCHLRTGVAQGSPPGRVESTSPVVHQDPDWSRGMSQRHGQEARRAITTCVSCHAGQECVSCHAFVNPHPPGFSSRCEALLRAGSTACAHCHESTAGLCD